MVALTRGTERRLLPASWEEAGPLAWQLLRDVVRFPHGAGKLRALRRLSGLSQTDFNRLTVDDVETLDLGTPWLGITPIQEPIRDILRHRLRTYYWPNMAFLDGQTLAFVLADEYFTAARTKEGEAADKALRYLVATLARPRTEIVTRELVEARAATFKKLPAEWSAQALMYWTGVKTTVDELYGDYLFRGAGESATKSTAPSFGWWSVLQDVAESGVFGNLERVYAAPFHDVCQYLVRKEGQRRDQQRQLEETKNK